MWHDIETTKDLLNFTVVAEIAAELVKESKGQPLSIGVSGNWGSGKSSMVKMIQNVLTEADKDNKKFVFLEFNAWLYQGYDDAKMALLQTVAEKLLAEAEARKTGIDKAKEFVKRVNWFRVGKLLMPTISSAILGGTFAGPVGALIGAVEGLCKASSSVTDEDILKVTNAYNALEPEITKLIREKEDKSIPKEISELRDSFEKLLESLDVTLIVLVDDLDRCLPNIAISTLEAMRLLLFLPRTAFIIAADERMIRGAVRAHFGEIEMNDDLVTSYFDKLIQVPLHVPRPGITEIKGYLILLFADLLARKGEISTETKNNVENTILHAVKHSWAGGLTQKTMIEAFGDESSNASLEIDISDQLASIMVSANNISGNPRLIKRFLNDLMIRDSIARAQQLTISFDQLVKIQLFERCASTDAFEYLAKQVADSSDGKLTFLHEIEDLLEKGDTPKQPDKSWENPFVTDWQKISPKLGDIDLRPLLYLSRNKTIRIANFDELSPDGRFLLEAISNADSFLDPLVKNLQEIEEDEARIILNRLRRKARSNQWDSKTILQALHIPKAFKRLSSDFVDLLKEIPASKRFAPLIPLIRKEDWAKDLLQKWADDENSPTTVRNAINALKE